VFYTIEGYTYLKKLVTEERYWFILMHTMSLTILYIKSSLCSWGSYACLLLLDFHRLLNSTHTYMSECLLNTGEMDTNKHSPNGTIDGVTNLSKMFTFTDKKCKRRLWRRHVNRTVTYHRQNHRNSCDCSLWQSKVLIGCEAAICRDLKEIFRW